MGYNRHQGNSGRWVRVETDEPPAVPPPPEQKTPPGPLPAHRGGLDGAFPRLGLEQEDWLVLGVLWLLYRSSGDEELLIAMGAYLFS